MKILPIFAILHYSTTRSKLSQSGYIASPIFFTPTNEEVIVGGKVSMGEYSSNDIDEINSLKPIYTEHGIDYFLKKTKELYKTVPKSLFFANTKIHAQNLKIELDRRGVRSEFLHSGTKKIEREHTINQFRQIGSFPVLINVDLFSEGIDIPNVLCCVLFRPTTSRIRYSQIIGRALRKSNEKQRGIIIDLTDTYQRMDDIVSDTIVWDMTAATGTDYKWKCSACFRINPSNEKIKCKYCNQKRGVWSCSQCGALSQVSTKKCSVCFYEKKEKDKCRLCGNIEKELTNDICYTCGLISQKGGVNFTKKQLNSFKVSDIVVKKNGNNYSLYLDDTDSFYPTHIATYWYKPPSYGAFYKSFAQKLTKCDKKMFYGTKDQYDAFIDREMDMFHSLKKDLQDVDLTK